MLLPRAPTRPPGKKRNKANVVTFSNKHNRKWQEPNLQYKKIYWEQGQRWVKLRICTKVRSLGSLSPRGLHSTQPLCPLPADAQQTLLMGWLLVLQLCLCWWGCSSGPALRPTATH